MISTLSETLASYRVSGNLQMLSVFKAWCANFYPKIGHATSEHRCTGNKDLRLQKGPNFHLFT